MNATLTGASRWWTLALGDFLDLAAAGLRCATNESGRWTGESVDALGQTGADARVALDAEGAVHVVYAGLSDRVLRYATNASGAWQAAPIGETRVAPGGLSLVLDARGQAHVAYRDADAPAVRILTNVGGVWQTEWEGDARTSPPYPPSLETSLALDDDGALHLVYWSGDGALTQLQYVTNASGSWSAEAAVELEAGGRIAGIVPVTDGTIHAVYFAEDRRAGTGELRHAIRVAGEWTSESIAQTRLVGRSTVATDASGALFVAYQEGTAELGALRIASNRDGAWSFDMVEVDPEYGVEPSIALGPSGDVHVAYGHGYVRFATHFPPMASTTTATAPRTDLPSSAPSPPAPCAAPVRGPCARPCARPAPPTLPRREIPAWFRPRATPDLGPSIALPPGMARETETEWIMDDLAAAPADPREPGTYALHFRPDPAELRCAGRASAGPRRLGVLDLGSNTFHLAIAEVEPNGALSLVADPSEPVRLVSALEQGTLDPVSWRRASRALSFLVACARGFDGLELVGVATGAFRSAENGARFLDAARRAHAVPIEVLSGAEEARLAFAGACSEAPPGADSVAVLDLGGGSTELAVGRAGACRFARSLPLGVLRLRHRHVGDTGIMTAEDARTIAETVALAARVVTGSVRRLRGATLMLTAGTARALARLLKGGGVDERPVRVERRHVEQLAGHLAGKRPDEIAALGVDPTRAETLGPGVVAISTWMTLLGFDEALVCRRGLREGVLLREASRRARAAAGKARRGDL